MGSLALPIGCIMGFVLPALLIDDKDGHDDLAGHEIFNTYLIIQNIIVSLFTLPLLFFARDKPPTPPSASASRKEEPLNFGKEMKELLKNKSYVLLCISFTCLYGVYTSLGAVVSAVT